MPKKTRSPVALEAAAMMSIRDSRPDSGRCASRYCRNFGGGSNFKTQYLRTTFGAGDGDLTGA